MAIGATAVKGRAVLISLGGPISCTDHMYLANFSLSQALLSGTWT
jgi:hypothetical protein